MPNRNGDSGDNNLDYRGETNDPPGNWPTGQAYYNIQALGGNDTVYGTKWSDWIDGGDGNDRLYGFNGDDTLLGGAGSDSLYGGDGNDYFEGGIGADVLWGENGNDWMVGGDGGDQLERFLTRLNHNGIPVAAIF